MKQRYKPHFGIYWFEGEYVKLEDIKELFQKLISEQDVKLRNKLRRLFMEEWEKERMQL